MNANQSRRAMLAVATALSLGILSGCAWSIGGKKEGEPSLRPTVGQELIELKKAKDQGAITEEEYEQQKTRILEQGTNRP